MAVLVCNLISWRQEDERFKIILSYIVHLRPTWDPVSKIKSRESL